MKLTRKQKRTLRQWIKRIAIEYPETTEEDEYQALNELLKENEEPHYLSNRLFVQDLLNTARRTNKGRASGDSLIPERLAGETKTSL